MKGRERHTEVDGIIGNGGLDYIGFEDTVLERKG